MAHVFRKPLKLSVVALLLASPSPSSASRFSFMDDGKDKNILDKLAENARMARNTASTGVSDILGNLKSSLADNGIEGLDIKDFFQKGYHGQIGYGFLMGYSSGYAMKKVRLGN